MRLRRHLRMTTTSRRRRPSEGGGQIACVRASTGEDHPSFQTVSTFLSVVAQFDAAVGEGQRALEGGGA